MRFDEPHIIIDHTFATKTIELQAVMQSIVQISVWARENAPNLLQVFPEESVATSWVRGVSHFISEDLSIEEGW